MLSRGVLAVRPLANLVQKRGMAAVKNWKRPSMDEYLVPTESWSKVHAAKVAQSRMILAVGIVTLTATIAFGRMQGFLMLSPLKPEHFEVK